MKYPPLVPDSVCKTPVTVQRTKGIKRDGSPDIDVVYEGKCFYSEKTYQKLTPEKQLITLSGEALFNGDIAPDVDNITGSITVLHGITRNIYASQKARNPDGTVNYTRLELI